MLPPPLFAFHSSEVLTWYLMAWMHTFVLFTAVVLSGCLHCEACKRAVPVYYDLKLYGRRCPLDDSFWGSLFKKLRKRKAVEPVLIRELATAAAVSEELGGISNLNSVPMSNSSIHSNPQTVALSLKILRLSDFSQRMQTFDMHYSLTWYWRDCRLLTSCMMVTVSDQSPEFSMFWTPPSRIKEQIRDETSMVKKRLQLFGHGWASLQEEHVSTFRCSFNFADLPFDTQTCKLTFLFPGEPDTSFRLDWNPIYPALESSDLSDGEWDIDQSVNWRRGSGSEEFTYFMGKGNSSVLTAEFKIRRRSRNMLQTYVTASVLFYLLSWIGLWIDPAAVPARAAIGIITVLVIANRQSALSSDLPPIGYSTRLDSFVSLSLFMLVVHMLEYGVVHYSGRHYKRLLEGRKRLQEAVDLEDKYTDNKDTHSFAIVAWPTFSERIVFRIAQFAHLSLEVHMRWLSLLVYLVAGVMIFS
eukprot:TRINITY_DN73921_c0_g1_i1.p1 TRINITY_DN73921_c0_g1~~TRINITY_DN73921_c0_g1_i1.p1  ORF type:complete len:470 (-),score=54.07 TRINITY_DN73921_c0_g1_i1:258-1667(-)